ncbi:MAG: hypothetical protein ACTHLT_06440 [Devosia sp.]
MPSISARLSLVVLLFLSLGAKAWTSGHAAETAADAPDTSALLATLSAEGFALSQAGGYESPFRLATRGECRVGVTTVSPLGWHQSALAAQAGGQTLAYVYGGHLYAEQPVLLTKLGYYWHKLTAYFLPIAQTPVYAVLTSRACAAQSVDPTRIAQLLP